MAGRRPGEAAAATATAEAAGMECGLRGCCRMCGRAARRFLTENSPFWPMALILQWRSFLHPCVSISRRAQV